MKPEIESALRAGARTLFWQVWAANILPKPKRSPSVWASEVRIIAAGQSPLSSGDPIRYRHAVMPHCVEPMDDADDPSIGKIVLWFAIREGKALCLDTLIPTPDGWKRMGDIREGDLVFDENGNQCRVVIAKPVMENRPCYRVRFSDGTELIADGAHNWFTVQSRRRSLGPRGKNVSRTAHEPGIRTTEQIKQTLKIEGRNAHAIPLISALKCREIEIGISFYVLGLWLGDGDKDSANISCGAADVNETCSLIESEGHAAKAYVWGGKCPVIKIDDRVPGKRYNKFIRVIRELGLFDNKHIPYRLLRASQEQRLALLQGLMDSDGTVDITGKQSSFSSTTKPLCVGVMELARSLGLKPMMRERITRCQNGASCQSWIVSFFPILPVFRLNRKLSRVRQAISLSTRERRIVAVERIDSVPVRCIGVDSCSHLFLAGEGMVPTHNTGGICCNILGRTVTDDPGNIYSVHPTKDDVDSFSAGDIEPMIEACLEGYFVEKKSRDSGRTIAFKKFKGGWLRIVSAGSLTKFRGKSVKVLFLHELDALNPEAIYKAIGRTTGFADAIIVEESTGTLAPTLDLTTGEKIYNSQIHKSFEEGSQHKWFSECQACHCWQIIRYDNFSWPPGRMERATWKCVKCDYEHSESEWRKAAQTSRWFPTAGLTDEQQADILVHHSKSKAKYPHVRSRWKNGFTSLLPTAKGFKTKLHEFVAKGEAAKTSVTALRVWTQEIASELWDPELEGEPPPPWKPIFDRREDYGLTVPEKGLSLHAFVDCQLNRLEVGWRAFGRNEESWGMDHVVLDGHIRDPEVWRALRGELARKFEHELGCTIQLSMAFVDGGAYAEDVYRFFQTLARDPVPGVNGHVRASKGIGQHGHPIVTRKMMTIAKNLKGHHIGTWEAKDRLYERLRMEPLPDDTREGIIHFNKQYGEEYFQQLTSEIVTITYEKGVEVRKYVNPKNVRNEALDIEVGALAALRLHPKNFDAIEKELKDRADEAKKSGQAQPPKRKRKESEWLKW